VNIWLGLASFISARVELPDAASVNLVEEFQFLSAIVFVAVILNTIITTIATKYCLTAISFMSRKKVHLSKCWHF
jgi:hypothetical protein